MVLAPRILYGLHERFVVFPYAASAPHMRLVVRARYLFDLCVEDSKPQQLGCPEVLGELYGDRQLFSLSNFVPLAMTGQGVHSFVWYASAKWALRWYRTRVLHGRSLCFESGSKNVYTARTAYYDMDLLRELAVPGSSKHGTSQAVHRDRGPPAG